MTFAENYRRLPRFGGLATWAAVGLPVLVFQFFKPPADRDALPLSAWIASFLLYGAVFWLAPLRSPPSFKTLANAGEGEA
jgi:hypothetical protein